MGSETLPSACYILSDESSIPFYSTSNGYKKGRDREEVTSETLLRDKTAIEHILQKQNIHVSRRSNF